MINTFENLTTEKLIHGITTRIGGVSKGDFSAMNTGVFGKDCQQDVFKNLEIVFSYMGITAPKVFMTHQVHSAKVMVIDQNTDFDAFKLIDVPEGVLTDKTLYMIEAYDAMVTNRTDVALMTFHADCVPIIAYDPANQVVAAIHSGWKGTALAILTETLNHMKFRFGSDVKNIKIGIGQSAGICCYEVGKDVIDAMRLHFDANDIDTIINPIGNDKYRIDLKRANQILAIKAGVLERNIEVNADCTICQSDLYHSHRAAKGGNRGMMSAIVQLLNK